MSEDKRIPIGMWALYHGFMDSCTRVAYWNCDLHRYEIDTPKGQIVADLMLDLENKTAAVYPQLRVIDYPTGTAIRAAAMARDIAFSVVSE